MVVGLIIAAGKQRRFKSETPKALAKIGDKTISELNIEVLNKFCDKTYIVVSKYNHLEFLRYFNEDNLLDIGQSGIGSGHAIFSALKLIDPVDKVVICWGDTILNEEVVLSSIGLCNVSVVVPVVYDSSPYVQFKDGKVLFSKYGDNMTPGYHDLSLFVGDFMLLYNSCKEFNDKYFDEDDFSYSHKHGKEFEFLDVFNDTDLKYKLLEFDNIKDYSFNTLDELSKIKNILGGRQ